MQFHQYFQKHETEYIRPQILYIRRQKLRVVAVLKSAQNERVDRGSRCCQMAARNGGLLYRLKGPVGLGMSFVGVNVIVG